MHAIVKKIKEQPLSTIANFFAGEFVLKKMPNGGPAILLRSIWVTAWIYLLAILLNGTCTGTLTWFGAIFTVAYAGFYARFSSQWAYLANLYNLILQVQVEAQLAGQQLGSSGRPITANAGNAGTACFDPMTKWKAAFIEDAEEVHLATKPMYAMIISDMLRDQKIRDCYIEFTPGRDKQLIELEAKINAVLDRKKAEWDSR